MAATTDTATLEGFVERHARTGATACTDEAAAYQGLSALRYRHERVQHSVSEYVNGMAHTNGMESFWSHAQRGYVGIHHKISPKHLDRYVSEFSGRHNLRSADTRVQMARPGRGHGRQAAPPSQARRRQRPAQRGAVLTRLRVGGTQSAGSHSARQPLHIIPY